MVNDGFFFQNFPKKYVTLYRKNYTKQKKKLPF